MHIKIGQYNENREQYRNYYKGWILCQITQQLVSAENVNSTGEQSPLFCYIEVLAVLSGHGRESRLGHNMKQSTIPMIIVGRKERRIGGGGRKEQNRGDQGRGVKSKLSRGMGRSGRTDTGVNSIGFLSGH